MRTGHVDGAGTVYNENGEPILGKGERIIRSVANDRIDVSEGSSLWNMQTLFGHTAEKGTLHITDGRIIFLLNPDPFLAAKYDAYPLGVPEAVAKAFRARALKSRKALEFCEIELDEVEGFWVKKRTYGVLFLRTSSDLTRKAIMYQRGAADDKFQVLKSLLSSRLPMTEPDDRKGGFLLGVRHPFTGRRQ